MTPAAPASAVDSDPRSSVRHRVFVVGAGIMGSGIAAQAALAGYAVTLEDVSEELAARGRRLVEEALDGVVQRGKLAPSAREEGLRNLDVAIGLRRADSAEIIVEAAPESLELKKRLFAEIESVASPQAILATNTSSLPITSIAAAVRDPGRVVGLHFFNPVLAMPLVELIPGARTRPEVTEAARAFATDLGKRVVTSRDTPGFVTSRALAVLGNEAVWMLYEGTASRDDIDAAYKLGFRHPMGPLELLDLVGLDTALAILDILWDGFKDTKYRACPLLRTMVAAGKLGRKTGEGFYTHPTTPSVAGGTA
ncbi:MAG: 3-hydroxyacyl-CoA dehydrogenase NAD-binding domain-containing protein [Thermoplasmata archaeon]|nr:3-hydroxyacyl-CoA dehydrogenase NAD-binding domain-containing protein [Thermoplasmata archaeon]